MARLHQQGFRRAVVLFAVIWLALALGARAAEPKFPPLTGRVVDEAGLLSPVARDRIAGWLAQYERASKRQVVVATVKTLQGYSIEQFGYQLGRSWGIGEKGLNTGVILLVAPNERAVRIEVGYGLEGELTDAISRAIIEQTILPAFRQGSYEQGITQGTAAILRALGWTGDTGVSTTETEQPPDDVLILLFIVLVIIFLALRHGRHGIWLVPMGQGVWGSRSREGFPGGGGFAGRGGSFGGGGASGRW